MKKNCLILLITILFFSCSKNDLDRTIFIPDEEDYNLPAYTEWGYNTFGAEYERDYFLASNKIIPCKIVVKENQLQFLLSGKIRNNQEMTLMFIFPSTEIKDYKELLQLHKTEIDLSAKSCIVKILQKGNEQILGVIKGKLFFKRVQVLSVDDQVNRVILSGTFELNFLQNNLPTSITNGRFDLGITENLFYAY